MQLRWDKADIIGVIQVFICSVESLCLSASDEPRMAICDFVDAVIVSILSTAANLYVPTRSKSFYKFWWDINPRPTKICRTIYFWFW